MSVISSFNIESTNNIVKKLEDMGALVKGKSYTVPHYDVDENGHGVENGKETHFIATVDLSVLWPEDWEKYSQELFARGVCQCAGVSQDICEREYTKHIMARKTVPEGRIFEYYAKNQKGVWGYYTRDTKGTPESSQFIELSKEEQESIHSWGTKILKMYQKTDRKGVYRRDLLDSEKADYAKYRLSVNEEGTEIFYDRNYATGYDESILDYIAHALPEEKLHATACCECICYYEGYSENGKFGPNIAPSEQEQEEALYGIASEE